MFFRNFAFLGILFIGAFLRFYKLDWGEGNFFHPDEYHIAAAVNRISFPTQMNPRLFTYGSFVIYLIYFTRLVLIFLKLKLFNLNPILLGRFYSALFSTLTIAVVFLLFKRLLKSNFGSHLAALLTTLTPGLVQQAHFATPESILTFWILVTLFFLSVWSTQGKLKFLYLAAVSLGLALATKIVALLFLPFLVIPFQNLSQSAKRFLKDPIHLIRLVVFPLLITGLVFFLVFPFVILDYRSFRSSMNYEVGVGRGTPIVFYTRQFINTVPLLFQAQKILPYAIGLPVLLLGVSGFILMSLDFWRFLKSKNSWVHFLVILFFLTYFLFNSFLFAKWTRFIAPTFPFFAIFAAYFIAKIKNKILLVVCYILVFLNIFWMMMFFSIYLRPDIRITASEWIKDNLPFQSVIFTEQGNVVEVPFRGVFRKISLDFYSLEEDFQIQRQISEYLAQADYFIVQSRRLFFNHQRLSYLYPKTAKFYDQLFSSALGFEKIKEFSSYPKFSIFPVFLVEESFQLSIPDETAEETWSVFDHPVIRIYKKTKFFSPQEYEKLLGF